jgi:isopentenyl diphosphate isomerase/L-lactate dehydrogenase-like FMN-dependent dehydrogenase
VGTGTSFQNNIKALSKYNIITRYIHGVTIPDTSCEFLGIKLSAPVAAAPITGTHTNMGGGMSEEDYARAVISGCNLSKTIAFIGDGATPSKYKIGIDTAAELGGNAIPVFKPRADESEILKRIEAAYEAGLPAVGIDIDAAAFITMALKGQAVEPKSIKKLKNIIKKSKLPVIIKGIMSKEDALSAIDAGACAIIVSNHGGRVLDYMPGAMDVLAGICDAVKKKVPVIADGGARSGIDIAKYIAMGADIVSVGRPVSIGAYGGDDEGVYLVMEQLKEEFYKTMLLTGSKKVSDIGKDILMLS